MACYLDRSTQGLKDLFTEDGTFEGAFSAGVLKGRELIESHYRQSFRGVFARGIVRFLKVAVKDRQVFLEWELDCPGERDTQRVPGFTTLDLDERGLIRKAKAAWDPKALKGWKSPG